MQPSSRQSAGRRRSPIRPAAAYQSLANLLTLDLEPEETVTGWQKLLSRWIAVQNRLGGNGRFGVPCRRVDLGMDGLVAANAEILKPSPIRRN